MGTLRLLGAIALAVAVCAAFTAAPAVAGYAEVGSFAGGGPGEGGSGSADGQLSTPGQADVRDTTGNVYVADTGNNRVQVFRPTEEAAEYDSQVAISAPTGLAIDQASGSVYVANASGISKFDSGLNPVIVGWSDPGVTGALAVDPASGDLLVADAGANLVRRYKADGTAAGSFAADRPIDLAVDSTGDVIVVTSTGDVVTDCSATSSVRRFSAAGALEATIGESLNRPGAVAVDPDDDSVVVAAEVAGYFCGSGLNPRLAFFAADGTATETVALGGDTLYAMVPGLAAQGGGSNRAYAVTKSPVNDSNGSTKVTVLKLLPPPEATIDPVNPQTVGSTKAVLRGTVNTNGTSTSWHFEYRPAGSTSWVSTPGQGGSGPDPVEVEANIAGLQPGLEYEARLVATSAGGTASSTSQSFQTISSAPLVATLPVVLSGPTSALLRGTINAEGEPTTYYFEYGLDESYGAQVPVGRAGWAGRGGDAVRQSQWIHGLQPGATYHFRVVATNHTGTSFGADLTFTTKAAPTVCPNEAARISQRATVVPDCRAWEMVSPPHKNGSDVRVMYSKTRSAADGGAVTFTSTGAFPGTGAVAAGSTPRYVARRAAERWIVESLDVPFNSHTLAAAGPLLWDQHNSGIFSEDLSRSAVWNFGTPLAPEALTDRVELYRQTGSTAFDLVSRYELPPEPPVEGWGALAIAQNAMKPKVTAFTDDFSHIVFQTPARLLPAASPPNSTFFPTNDKTYEWDEGELRLVGIAPDGTPLGWATLPNPNSFNINVANTFAAMSRDGSRIAFVSQPDSRLFVREHGGEPSARTIWVSKSERAVPIGEPQPATFRDATPDGRFIYFTTAEQLTDDDSDSAADLYRFDIEAPEGSRLTRLSRDLEPADGTAADVRGVLGIAEDGSRAYFMATGRLLPGIPADAATAKLYLAEGAELRYVTDFPEWKPGSEVNDDDVNWTTAMPTTTEVGRQAEVTGNATRLLFAKARPYDQAAYAEAGIDDFASVKANYDLYLYDAIANELRCVSCREGPDEHRGLGVTLARFEAQMFTDQYGPRTLVPVAGGVQVFFTSWAALVPEDVNSKADAYRYDSRDQSVALLSSGNSSAPSYLADVSADGRDAFFVTREPLSAWDTDSNADLYDARTNGGLPEPPRVEPACTGDACQEGATPVRAGADPGSATLAGPGKAAARKPARRCAKRAKTGHPARKCRKSSPRRGKRDNLKQRASQNRGAGK